MRKLLLGLLAVLLSTAAGAQYKTGDVARDFKLKNIDGKMVSMSKFKEAKGFIVIFTCNHCPWSQAYEQRIIDLDKKFKEKGFPVIAINPNDPDLQPEDSFDEMKKRAKKYGYTFPYLVDETQDVARDYGATRTPHVYVLNKEEGKMVVRYIGAIDDNTEFPDKVSKRYVEDAVNDLLEGLYVRNGNTKAVGCTIKWKKS
ncbi:MAG: thioredoxin family protein [Sphingobacteriaceae bacterium]|nr:thioredoxin family protein [Sphingobacteriaceae bacterium]